MDKLIIINQNNTFITSTPLLVPVQARAIVTLTHTLVSLTPIPPSLSEQSNQILISPISQCMHTDPLQSYQCLSYFKDK